MKTVGIIGYGNIGMTVSDMLHGFRVNIMFNDPAWGEYSTPLEDILENADIITIHVPLTDKTKYLIDEYELSLMSKKSPILINMSRKEVVEEDAVYEALMLGELSGFGSDVNDAEMFSEFDNAIITPHIGSDTIECKEKMEIATVNNLIRGLNEKKKSIQ